MQLINNAGAASPIAGALWRKSRYSNPCGSCVELAQLVNGRIAVRNSRHPGGPTLTYSCVGMAVFIHGVKAGEFDGVTAGNVTCGQGRSE